MGTSSYQVTQDVTSGISIEHRQGLQSNGDSVTFTTNDTSSVALPANVPLTVNLSASEDATLKVDQAGGTSFNITGLNEGNFGANKTFNSTENLVGGVNNDTFTTFPTLAYSLVRLVSTGVAPLPLGPRSATGSIS